MKKVLTLGGAMQDIFLEYECPKELHQQGFVLLPVGKKLEVNNLVYTTGGGATNAAVSFARLGYPTQSFFKIGTDPAGTMIVNALQHDNVQTSYALQSKTTQTGTSFIIPCPSGERTVLVYRGANTTLQENELPLDAITNADVLYITSLSNTNAQLIAPITLHAKKNNTMVATNPGTSQLTSGASYLHDALPHIDILILNVYEASLLAKTFNTVQQHLSITGSTQLPPLLQPSAQINLPHFLYNILEQGVGTIVVTNGSDGVYVAHKNTIYYHPAPQVNVVSTIGAGDAFGSTFVAYLGQNKPIEEAIRAGITQSGFVLQHLDAKTGLLTIHDLEPQIMKLNKQLLQIFVI